MQKLITMQGTLLHPSIEKVQDLFADIRFSEQRIIEFFSDQYLKLLTLDQAFFIADLIIEDYNPKNDLQEHIDWACYDYFKSNSTKS